MAATMGPTPGMPRGQRLHPAAETAFQHFRIQQGQDLTVGAVRRCRETGPPPKTGGGLHAARCVGNRSGSARARPRLAGGAPPRWPRRSSRPLLDHREVGDQQGAVLRGGDHTGIYQRDVQVVLKPARPVLIIRIAKGLGAGHSAYSYVTGWSLSVVLGLITSRSSLTAQASRV